MIGTGKGAEVATIEPDLVADQLLAARAGPVTGDRIDRLLAVLADARDLSRRLGSADREKFGEYVESIRTIERQMDKLSRMKA